MSENKKHSDTIYIVMVVVIILVLLWYWLNNQTSTPASTTTTDTIPNGSTIPPASSGSPSPTGVGTVNVTFQNEPQATGISTYIPLFGFLRYGAFFG
jgi:hypothetical protein